MYRNYRPSTYGTATSSTKSQLQTIMQRIQNAYKQADLHKLIYLTDISMTSFAQSMLKIRMPEPTIDHNMSNTLQQKLMIAQQKNHILMIRMLNIRASLAKQNNNIKKSKHQDKFMENIQQMREKAYQINEKKIQLKQKRNMKAKTINMQTQRTKLIANQLNKLSSTLSHEVVRLKTQVNTLKHMYPDLENQP